MPGQYGVFPMNLLRAKALSAAVLVLALFGPAADVGAAGLAEPLALLRSVGPEGKGHEAAGAAWRTVSKAGLDSLPELLAAMDGANDYALNWIRSAVDSVVQRGLASDRPLPVEALGTFLRDTRHHPRARRLAWELIRKVQPETAKSLLPGFLDDPGVELRREAVQQVVDQAEALPADQKAGTIAGLRKALDHSREADQIDAIAKRLKDLGDPVDLQKTFGWVTRWKLVGPFDNTGGAGFARVFPPEEKIDLTAQLEGKKGAIQWSDYESKSEYGVVDLNAPLGKIKGAAGYALAEFWSKTERPVQIRLGSEVGWKVWVNGRYLFGRDEYHRASEIDQYRLPAILKPGRNQILVKSLQNEQTEDWAVDWQFQLRVTDEQGAPILSTP
jgi:hypothetical protein